MKRAFLASLSAVVAVGVVSLAGCGGSSSDSTMTGDNPGTWAPLEITQSANGTTLDMVVDQAAIFTDLPDSPTVVVESSDSAVVEASQAEGEGEVTAVAGLIARSAGTSTITVKDTSMPEDAGGASNVIMEFTVNVTAP